jgi:hypothetical protein
MFPNFRAASFCGLVLGVLCGQRVSAAETTRLVPATADSTLRQHVPNQNRGDDSLVRLGWSQGSRSVVRFDPAVLASTVASGRLVSAHLELWIENSGENWVAQTQLVGVHRMTSGWSESGVTWNCAIDSRPGDNRADCLPAWNGGAVVSQATAVLAHRKSDRGWARFDVTADVAEFLAGGPNFGWLLRKLDESLSGRVDYSSREGNDPGHVPRLVLVVDLTTEPDLTAPTLEMTEPQIPILRDQPSPGIRVEYQDGESGVRAESLQVWVDGVEVTGTCQSGPAASSCQLPALTSAVDGVSFHHLVAMVEDRAGNAAQFEQRLLLIQGRGDVSAPRVTFEALPQGSLTSQQSLVVRGTVIDDGVVALVSVQGQEAAFEAGVFEATVSLEEGENVLHAWAWDGSGKQGGAELAVTLDTTPPELRIWKPQPELVTTEETLTLEGSVADLSGVSRVTVDGVPVAVVEGVFQTTIVLEEGAQTFVVSALDAAGNEARLEHRATRISVPKVTISIPSASSSTTATELTVLGTVSGPSVAVEVNGLPAEVSGETFQVTGVPVFAGANSIVAIAAGANGLQATASVMVLRDTVAPRLGVSYPLPYAAVTSESVAVQGFVSDHGEGALDSKVPRVTVNGQEARVANETFLVEAVPLAPGDNQLVVVAVDTSGNRRSQTVYVRRETVFGPRLQILAGNFQRGALGAPLAEPLVVRLLDGQGQPVAERAVLFSARGTEGTFPNGKRQFVGITDAAGVAQTEFSLGNRAGAGLQRVEAFVAGFGPSEVFLLSAEVGPPALIVADGGDQQVGAAGQPLAQPLVATVVDAGSNRLAGSQVRFEVVQGDGLLGSGARTVVVETDFLGRAAVMLTLGNEEGIGNHVVEATVVDSNPVLRTSFTASSRTPGESADTSISGVVLDNTLLPVPGATIHLKGKQGAVTTDAEGHFRIEPVPVGTHLLVVDGASATRPGTWPQLEFVLTTVPGRDNTVNMPIYLLPLDPAGDSEVDEASGATLTLPEFPGFALEIAPGSVTFPNGSRRGIVNATVVHADRVPMVPNFGQQPRFIVTIQPAGALFDPPARLTLPNLDGLAPGAVTEMYSFDHDLGRFLSIGLATVSDDGTVVTSNPGSGVRKAGWHCGGNPSQSGTTHQCNDCHECIGNRCVARDGGLLPDPTSGDCNRPLCFQGFKVNAVSFSDVPAPTPGDCKTEVCKANAGGSGAPISGFVGQVTDDTDTAPDGGCCKGEPFALASECCTAVTKRVVPKHPMPFAWPVECPDRVPFPGHTPGANGCGSESLDVPDNPNVLIEGCEAADFRPDCNVHDECYDTCGKSQQECDANFLRDMLATCQARCTSPSSVQLCSLNASAYFVGVSQVGETSWIPAQRQACQCCN